MRSFTFYFSATLAILLLSFSSAEAQVFSNEIHYDNFSTDVNERIEVAGPAGTDLSGWSLVLYDGSTGQTYGAANLSGILPNQCTVMGQNIGTHVTLASAFVPATTFQGATDGWALVQSGTVIEFLTYEGTFTATNGPAAGMTSTNIVAFEDGNGSTIGSIQRTGLSTWVTDPNANTFGACNTPQQLTALPIQLLTFSATIVADGIKLSWTTASETQNDYFSIERSGDGTEFEPIGEKDGNGTTSQRNNYTFTDQEPLNGNNYYRLKQVDEDGTSTYSPVRLARFGKSNPVAVYPNPSGTGTFNIVYASVIEGSLQVSLKNAAGVEVHSQIVNVYKGENLIPVSSVNTPDGPYWMVVTTESQTSVIPVQIKTN